MSEGGVDWAGLRVRDGVGMGPGPVGDMLRAPDSGSGDEAYWRIEGTAFYSHELEEASEPLTRVLVDAVCDGDGTPLGARARHGHARGDHLRLHLPPRGGGRQCRSGRPVPGHRAPRLPRLYRLVVALGRCPRHARQPRRRRAGRYSGR